MAAAWMLRYPEEVYSSDYVGHALDALDSSAARAELLATGRSPWTGQPNLPSHQRRALHIYNAVDYSLNAVNVPLVGHGGENNAQLQAAVNVREALMREGFHFTQDGLNWNTNDLCATFPVEPNIGHRFHPKSKAESNRFIDQMVAQGRQEPDRL